MITFAKFQQDGFAFVIYHMPNGVVYLGRSHIIPLDDNKMITK
jgi:hypothetical protein